MVTRALICLLAFTFAQGKVVPSGDVADYPLDDSINSIIRGSSSYYNMIGMRDQRVATDEWDRQFNIPLIGLTIKIKYADTTNIFKGGRVFIEFPVPKMLTYFTMGVTDVVLDMTFVGKDVTKGLFEIKIDYKLTTTTSENKVGSVMLVREIQAGKVVTKCIVNGQKVDIVMDTDYINKFHITCNLGGKAFGLTINRMKGTSFVMTVSVNGVEYTTQTSFDWAKRKVFCRHLVNQDKKYQGEIILNPLSQEWGVVLVAHIGRPLYARIILDKDLHFAHLVLNYNKVNYVFVKIQGNVQKSSSSKIPASVEYSVDFNLETLCHGKVKINFNGAKKEKVLTINFTLNNGNSFVWEMKGKMEADFSHTLTHKLMSNTVTYYTMSHSHKIITLTSTKVKNVYKDTCSAPVTSPLYNLLKSTYLGNLLINTKMTPFSLSLYYPTGPQILGHNLGLKNMVGQDSVTATVTVTPDMEMVVKTDIYNLIISLQGPNNNLNTLVSALATYTEENKILFEFAVNKAGSLYKVNLFSTFFTPKLFTR